MPENNDTTTRFKVDISELKQGMQEAKRQIRLANAEFSAASSGMDDWKNSADGVSEKLKQLDTVLGAQNTILDGLKQQYQMVAAEQGENSRGAQELAIKIANQQAAVNKTEREIKEYKQTLRELNGESENAGQSAQDLADNMEDAAKNAQNAESGFTILKGALADLLANGIKGCIDGLKNLTVELLNDSSNAYAQFSAATGTAASEMGKYEDAIKSVYKNNFGESLEDVAQKMAKVKEITGEVDASKLQDLTEKGMTLEDTFGMDMTESLRGVTNLMNHFGLTSEQAFDLMSAGAQNGLNYSDELGDNVAEYSGKFAEAGYSATEYFQLLQNGSQGGAYNLDKVNDAVNEVTTRLADGTISDNIKSFSSGTQELFNKWQNGGATQKEVINSIVNDIKNTKSEQDKMNLAASAFGTMAEDGGTKFIQALTPVGKTFKDVKGSADELAAVKYDTPLAALQGIGRTVKTDLLGPLADELKPVLEDIASWLTENLPAFTDKIKEIAAGAVEVVTELSQWTPLIAGIGTAVATYFAVTQISSFVSWIKSGSAAIKAMEIAQAALNVVMNMNPIGIVLAAITGLIAGFTLLWNKSEGFRDFWKGLWDGIKNACGSAKDWISDKIDSICSFFTETIPNAMGSIVSWIQKNWSTILLFLINPFAGLFKYFYQNNKKFKEFVDNAINCIKELPGKLWQQFTSAIGKVAAFFSDIIGKAKTGATNFISGLIDKIKELPGKMWEKFKDAISKVGDFAGKIKDKAVDAGKNLFNGIIDNIKNLPGKVLDIGGNIVSGLWNGINDKFEWLTSKIKGFAKSVTNKIKEFFGIHSPSRVMRDQVGKYLALGIAKGITENKDAVNRALDSVANEIKSKPLEFDVNGAKSRISSSNTGRIYGNGQGQAGDNSTRYTFNQYNTSPKALSRLEIYRQTKNQLEFAKGV